jgi:hypothetical protein
LIKSIGKDGFASEEIELLLLPFHEAKALSGGNDHGIGFHQSTDKIYKNGIVQSKNPEWWNIGIMECWIKKFEFYFLNPLFQYSIVPFFQTSKV